MFSIKYLLVSVAPKPKLGSDLTTGVNLKSSSCKLRLGHLSALLDNSWAARSLIFVVNWTPNPFIDLIYLHLT